MAEKFLNPEFDEGSGVESKFSVAALASFLMGLLSPLVLINPALISLTVFAIVLGFIALFRARQRGISVLSQGLAIVGIAACLLMSSWSATRNVLTQNYIYDAAAKYGEEYLARLAKGDVDGVLADWTVRSNTQETSGSPDTFNATTATILERKNFLESPGRKEVIDRGEVGKWRFDSRRTLRTIVGGNEVSVAFRDISRPKSPLVILVFRRLLDSKLGEQHFSWKVTDTRLE